MKSIIEKINESENTGFTFYKEQMMAAYAGLQCLYNHKNKEYILELCGIDEDTLDDLLEDMQDEINNKKECDDIIKQCI